MKHSWQEKADGTAKCRRCSAVRKEDFRSRVSIETRIVNDAPYMGPEYEYVADVPVMTFDPVVIVTGAHPTKCGKPAR